MTTPLQWQTRDAVTDRITNGRGRDALTTAAADAAYAVVEPLLQALLDEIEKGAAEVATFDPRCEHIGWDPGMIILRAKEALGVQGDS